MAKLLLLMMTALLLTSCYRMPGDDDYCLIPATNNPTVTNQKGGSFIPSTSY